MNQRLISKIKFNSYRLYKSYQLPKYLYFVICHLGNDISEDHIKLLIDLTELYMRVKGFYKKYTELDAVYENEIKLLLKEGGFAV